MSVVIRDMFRPDSAPSRSIPAPATRAKRGIQKKWAGAAVAVGKAARVGPPPGGRGSVTSHPRTGRSPSGNDSIALPEGAAWRRGLWPRMGPIDVSRMHLSAVRDELVAA